MKKIMAVIGTRPDGIKMCPLIEALRSRGDLEVRVCSTGQHRELLSSVLDTFGIIPDYDLSVMREGQDLFDVTQSVMVGMRNVFLSERPDCVLVHGDTTGSFAAALAAFYCAIPVYHVEAGLRTGDLSAPYPEEFNRRAISLIAEAHFSPTEESMENLLSEGIESSDVYVTGNTVVDAIKRSSMGRSAFAVDGKRTVLLTVHRRENSKETLENIFGAVARIVREFPDVRVVYPMHPKPYVREVALRVLGGCEGVVLCEPLDMTAFHRLIRDSYLIVTDSGGVQEEAVAMGKPVLVVRNTTERREGIRSGNIRLIGTSRDTVYRGICELLANKALHYAMSRANNPFGDGRASEAIAAIVKEKMGS